MRNSVPAFLFLLSALSTAVAGAEIGYQAVPRDAFPVFDNPQMLSAAAAERVGVVFDNAVVIGVAHNGEAKAYPVAVMGVHELGNDTLGGVPIAVSW
jgi:hypothetical protein